MKINKCFRAKSLRHSLGFTLIEIIVVIAIIGTLSTALIGVIDPVGQLAKTRDSVRKHDLKILSDALGAYAVDHGGYPDPDPSDHIVDSSDPNWLKVLVSEGHLKALPKDPKQAGLFSPENIALFFRKDNSPKKEVVGIRTDSPPITAVSGQVIRGVRITSTTGSCITANNVTNVWIDDVELGPCGEYGIQAWNSSDIRITNSYIHTEHDGTIISGNGVDLFASSNVLIHSNRFERNETGVFALDSTNIRTIGNYSLNPLGPFPRGPHFQYVNVTGGRITDNYGQSIPDQFGATGTTDNINTFRSSDILIARNYMDGGKDTAGCGIIVGDTGGDRNTIEDNILIRTGTCGIGMAGGNGHIARRNKILDPSFAQGIGNIGMYSWDYVNAGGCFGHQYHNNIVSNIRPDGSVADWWDGGNCGPITMSGNIFTPDGARALLTPEYQKFPPPPIPPCYYDPLQGEACATPPAPIPTPTPPGGPSPTPSPTTAPTAAPTASPAPTGGAPTPTSGGPTPTPGITSSIYKYLYKVSPQLNSFELWATLENTSDPQIGISQSKCGPPPLGYNYCVASNQ